MVINIIILNAFLDALKRFSFENVGEDQITLFLIGFGVVYIALTLIYLLINSIPKVLSVKKIKNKKTSNVVEKSQQSSTAQVVSTTGKSNEINAAISMALALYFDNQHDYESLVLTMNLKERISSQWNHKVLNVI